MARSSVVRPLFASSAEYSNVTAAMTDGLSSISTMDGIEQTYHTVCHATSDQRPADVMISLHSCSREAERREETGGKSWMREKKRKRKSRVCWQSVGSR